MTSDHTSLCISRLPGVPAHRCDCDYRLAAWDDTDTDTALVKEEGWGSAWARDDARAFADRNGLTAWDDDSPILDGHSAAIVAAYAAAEVMGVEVK